MARVPHVRQDAYGRVIAYANQESDRLEGLALDYLRTVEARLEGVPVESAVRFGNPGDEILLEADAFGADLIALTTAPRRWLLPGVFGTIARRIAKKAAAPVMLLAAR